MVISLWEVLISSLRGALESVGAMLTYGNISKDHTAFHFIVQTHTLEKLPEIKSIFYLL